MTQNFCLPLSCFFRFFLPPISNMYFFSPWKHITYSYSQKSLSNSLSRSHYSPTYLKSSKPTLKKKKKFPVPPIITTQSWTNILCFFCLEPLLSIERIRCIPKKKKKREFCRTKLEGKKKLFLIKIVNYLENKNKKTFLPLVLELLHIYYIRKQIFAAVIFFCHLYTHTTTTTTLHLYSKNNFFCISRYYMRLVISLKAVFLTKAKIPYLKIEI